ncbi:MAG: hypothetical protein J6I60_03820 [Bacteroidaceae bacterium]|nr:hypothetical protein [Bacteroidaceae bacterium]
MKTIQSPHRRPSLLNRLLAGILVLLGLAACKSEKKTSIKENTEELYDTMIIEPSLYGCYPDFDEGDYEQLLKEKSETIITKVNNDNP